MRTGFILSFVLFSFSSHAAYVPAPDGKAIFVRSLAPYDNCFYLGDASKPSEAVSLNAKAIKLEADRSSLRAISNTRMDRLSVVLKGYFFETKDRFTAWTSEFVSANYNHPIRYYSPSYDTSEKWFSRTEIETNWTRAEALLKASSPEKYKEYILAKMDLEQFGQLLESFMRRSNESSYMDASRKLEQIDRNSGTNHQFDSRGIFHVPYDFGNPITATEEYRKHYMSYRNDVWKALKADSYSKEVANYWADVKRKITQFDGLKLEDKATSAELSEDDMDDTVYGIEELAKYTATLGERNNCPKTLPGLVFHNPFFFAAKEKK